jgi:hypothetical protein
MKADAISIIVLEDLGRGNFQACWTDDKSQGRSNKYLFLGSLKSNKEGCDKQDTKIQGFSSEGLGRISYDVMLRHFRQIDKTRSVAGG